MVAVVTHGSENKNKSSGLNDSGRVGRCGKTGFLFFSEN